MPRLVLLGLALAGVALAAPPPLREQLSLNGEWLKREVRAGPALVDRGIRRFGFREIALRGNQFRWNGVRINLYGEYQVFGDTW